MIIQKGFHKYKRIDNDKETIVDGRLVRYGVAGGSTRRVAH